MTPTPWVRTIDELPDARDPQHEVTAGGDVRQAIWNAFAHALRFCSDLPPSSVALGTGLAFHPKLSPSERQERLTGALRVIPRVEHEGDSLQRLLEQSHIGRFYRLKSATQSSPAWAELHAACSITRKTRLVQPLFSREFNSLIPEAYWRIESFRPNEGSDLLLVDSVLDAVEEDVVIDKTVESTDISSQITAHTRYLERLQSINRHWNSDESAFSAEHDLFGDESPWAGDRAKLTPLRRRDPLVDDILRAQQRFHETFLYPHLRFRITVLAASESVARLVGSAVAESAFADGCYQLTISRRGTAEFESCIRSAQEGTTEGGALLHKKGSMPIPDSYADLEGLACVAPVSELVGALRLPVASYASPRCIRKNTDPPCENEADLIVLGYDNECGATGNDTSRRGAARGIPLHQLVKHMAEFGVPGSGKTMSLMNIAIQLCDMTRQDRAANHD